MNANTKLCYAIAAILSGSSAGLAYADPTPDTGGTTETAPSDSLAEITVTAQRRTENIQDVPISIQALTGETLQQLNIQTFDDYVKYLPNVTMASNGPGQNEVFMRGLSAGSQASQGSGSTGLWPNVAIYLDNQSAQLPNRNLDIYAADLNRIEVLEGPQGTLFGAGAEAGVIRYITNEPKLDVTEGNVKAGYSVTAHGDPNSDVTAVLNVPIIEGTFALRGVIYDDHRGGYIDNVPATFTRKDTDLGFAQEGYGGYGCAPGGVPPLAKSRRAAPPCRITVSSATTSTPSTIKGFASRPCTRSTRTGTCCSRSPTRSSARRACSTSSRMPRTVRRCSRSKSRCSIRPTTKTSSRARPGP